MYKNMIQKRETLAVEMKSCDSMAWLRENFDYRFLFSQVATMRKVQIVAKKKTEKREWARQRVGGIQRERVKRSFNTEEHISCFTQYNMAVQPSIVIHWKTVSMANPMLSKLVMPEFGPSQWSMHVETFASHTWAPAGASSLLSVLHGLGCSPSFMIIPATSMSHERPWSVATATLRRLDLSRVEWYIFSQRLLSQSKSSAQFQSQIWLHYPRREEIILDRVILRPGSKSLLLERHLLKSNWLPFNWPTRRRKFSGINIKFLVQKPTYRRVLVKGQGISYDPNPRNRSFISFDRDALVRSLQSNFILRVINWNVCFHHFLEFP